VTLAVQQWDAAPPSADILLSTVTAGAADARAEELAASTPVVFDVVYDPWPTRLGQVAAEAGCAVVNGLDLLVHQATEQVERMTGSAVDWRILMSAGRKALSVKRTA
jgi:shikimate dehydrogenase